MPAMIRREALLRELGAIAGDARVVTEPHRMERYTTGFRFGGGTVLAVVRPRSLVVLWRVLGACLAHDAAIIMQAANTGLTGGSTPDSGGYDRDIVLISAMALDAIFPIGEGRQVVCLPGATLHALERKLAPFGREPHSVIGSSCIGASVIGGVCNNSGGALVQRGPAYTQLALYAQRTAAGALELVNHLGIRLPGDPETALAAIEAGEFAASDIAWDSGWASDHDYDRRVRDVDAASPARFNADPRSLYEASGSAGKVCVFAVRLDTFDKPKRERVFYIGTNSADELTRLRRDILAGFANLPVSGEYIHRDCFDVAAKYGKDTFLAIRALGTARLPRLFACKDRVDRMAARVGLGGRHVADRLLQAASRVLPNGIPRRLRAYRDFYEHHLILRMADDGISEAEACLRDRLPSASGDCFACSDSEGALAMLHRFAAAGAAVRYRAVHADRVEGIVALDIALPRNAGEWVETLPEHLDRMIEKRLYYGHFFCSVFHQDYVVRKGGDLHAIEQEMLALLDARGAEYPAEHNVGHLYHAKPALQAHYRELDPCNSFNPGIGRTSKRADWR